MYCSNCGQELAPDAKFCSNCGAPVDSGAPSGEKSQSARDRERQEDFERAWGRGEKTTESVPDETPVGTEPDSGDKAHDEPYTGGFTTQRSPWEIEREQLREQPVDEWSMFDLGPPKPQRRRTWLWVLLGTIGIIVIACCVFGWWLSTDSGTDWFEGIATRAAEELQQATDEAATPLP